MAERTPSPSDKKPRKSAASPPPAPEPGPAADAPDMQAVMSDIAERSQRLIQDFLAKNTGPSSAPSASLADPLNVGEAFMALTQQMMTDPAKAMQAQVNLWNGYMDLWRNTTLRLMGQPADPVIAPEKSDRRFKDDAWTENAVFDYLKQSYLLTSKWMQSTVGEVEGLDVQTKRKVDFFTKQFTDAMSPTNFAMTNPEVLRQTAETKGENLVKGLQNMLADLEKGKGKLRISMTDETAFRVGENIAVTAGKVVFQNDLIQLIQYLPTTPQAFEIPIVIVPPWINKFYILDLRPKNSLVRWLTAQGFTVFVVSWVNPDEKLAAKTFDDYMIEGAIAAMNAAKVACNTDRAHMVGYCIGGTLLAGMLAYLKAKGDDSVATATFLTSMTDFKDIGEIRAFVDDKQLESLDQRMTEAGGFLDGADMATTFNMLRSNDLIWSFVVNNYLMGKEPLPFDLLYWNSDSTRMPKAMHSFYLWNMYLKNKLAEPGGISLGGVPIDLGTIDRPTYFLSCKDDHIAPWTSTYEGTKLMKESKSTGNMRFVLSGSGHIGGVVNPPEANKYGYWTNDKLGPSAPEWLAGATQHAGSWWPDWVAWLTPHSGPKVPARNPENGPLHVVEDAPGSYVKMRIA